MSDVIDRPILEKEASAKSRLRIIDCDVHPSLHARSDLNPFLTRRWQEHLKTYGDHLRTPYIGTTPYPRSSPLIARRDAWPPTGGPPGSDLDFMRKQHLDPLDVEFGILQVLDLFIFSQQNLDFGAAIQRAINEWQLANWTSREPRLKASILVGQDDTEAAIAEIERPAARYSCRRLWRSRADRRRLAVILCRGASVQRAHHGGDADEFRDRRRPRAFSAPENRVHRRRLRLDSLGNVANGPAFRAFPR
jgi:hypothetical protein